MTAYGSETYKERAMKEGAKTYVEKPFDMREFKKIVMGILG